MDIAGNSMPIDIPVENADCDCWRNEGEMVEWGNKIKEQREEIKQLQSVKLELEDRLSRRNDTIEEMRNIIQNLASALSKFILEDI